MEAFTPSLELRRPVIGCVASPWQRLRLARYARLATVAEDAKTPDVRLAELLAALSLGIDLGFGQPMEHVLRQCLIALRLAEKVGLDEDERAIVYYAALLVNVGCHSDADEQAKWFGDDIALKANKYEHSLHGAGPAVASLRLVGSGNPPLHRFWVGLDFLLSGHREVNDMIASHSRSSFVRRRVRATDCGIRSGWFLLRAMGWSRLAR